MGMKVKLSTSFLSPRHYFPSCTHSPKTHSFRYPNSSSSPVADDVFKTLNSVYFDDSAESSSSDHEEEDNGVDIESIIRGAHSKTSRLLFEPSKAKAISDPMAQSTPLLNLPDTKSATETLEEEDEEEEEEDEEVGPGPFKESVVMAMESEDPYIDFRRSMQEMVETHGLLKDWGCLEELLAWYLKVNGRKNHAYIVAAFVDLLVKFSSSSSSSSSSGVLMSSPKLNHEGCSSSSTSRSSSTTCVCACEDHPRRSTGNKSTTSFSSAASSFSNCIDGRI